MPPLTSIIINPKAFYVYCFPISSFIVPGMINKGLYNRNRDFSFFLFFFKFYLFNIQLVKLMCSFKDDGYCRYNLMVTGNISSLAACFFEDGGLRLDLSRCSVGSLVVLPVFLPATLETACASAPPPAGPVAPRLRPPRLPGGAAGAAGPRRRSGVTGASRRPPGGPGRLFLSSTAFPQICALPLKFLSFRLSFQLIPVHPSACLLLICLGICLCACPCFYPSIHPPRFCFYFSSSFPFPFFLGLLPALETLRCPSHLADAFTCDLPCFNDANFLPNFSLGGGGGC